jgi:hypothetical protein
MKAVVIILSIIAFVACLLIGMQAGAISRQTSDPTHSSAFTPIPPTHQRTFLIIFVDDIQSSPARLAGLWTVFYRPDTPRLVVIPLYPVDASDDLAKEFSLTSDRLPNPAFLKAVQNYHFQWDGYIIADTITLPALVDEFQGISIQGKSMDGKAAADTLKMPWVEREEALSSEKSLGLALCDRIAGQTPEFDVKKFVASLPAQHIQIEFNLDQLSQDWHELASKQSHIQCEFPIP